MIMDYRDGAFESVSPFNQWVESGGEFEQLFEGETRSEKYKRKLMEGLSRLNPTAGPRNGFDSPTNTGAYYKRDWSKRFDKNFSERFSPPKRYHMLVLDRRRSPTNAIKRIVDMPDKWSLDCAYFVQVAQLYALSQTDPTGFDRKYRGKPFFLRYHHSTGVRGRYYFDKERIGDDWRARFKKTPDAPRATLNRINTARWTTARIKAEMPVGSRLMWRNELIKPHHKSDFRNENAVKVGNDQYRAFGFGIRSKMSEDRIKTELAKIAIQEGFRDPGDPNLSLRDYKRRHIFLSEAQSFRGP